MVRKAVAGLAVFFVLASVWGALLGHKYGSFTFGVGGSYNYSIVGPDSPGRPIFYFGFIPVKYAAVTSIWEEPHWLAAQLEPWSPLDSPAALEHQLRLVAANARETAEVLQQFSMLSVTVLLGAVLLCLVPRRRLASRIPLVFWLVTIALYCGGYALVHSEERYLWGVELVILVIAGHLLSSLLGGGLLARRGQVAVASIVVSSSLLVTSQLVATGSQAPAGV